MLLRAANSLELLAPLRSAGGVRHETGEGRASAHHAIIPTAKTTYGTSPVTAAAPATIERETVGSQVFKKKDSTFIQQGTIFREPSGSVAKPGATELPDTQRLAINRREFGDREAVTGAEPQPLQHGSDVASENTVSDVESAPPASSALQLPAVAPLSTLMTRLAAMPISIAPLIEREPPAVGFSTGRRMPERTDSRTGEISRAEYQPAATFASMISRAERKITTAVARMISDRESSQERVYPFAAPAGALAASPIPWTALRIGELLRPAHHRSAMRAYGASIRAGEMPSPAQPRPGKFSATRLDSFRAVMPVSRSASTVGGPLSDHFVFSGTLQGWLPLYESAGLSSDRMRGTASSGQQPTQRPLPAVLTRWFDSAATEIYPSSTWKAASPLIQLTENTLIPPSGAAKMYELHSVPTAVFAPIFTDRAMASISGPVSQTPAVQRQHTDSAAIMETSYPPTFPVISASTVSARDGDRGVSVGSGTKGISLQPVADQSAPANHAVPISAGAEIRAVETPAAPGKPQIDLDELVEKAWQKLMRKLTVERERRGYTRWP
jgi:hypothetical protein